MHRLRLPETEYPTGYNATPSAARNCFPTLISCRNLRGPAKQYVPNWIILYLSGPVTKALAFRKRSSWGRVEEKEWGHSVEAGFNIISREYHTDSEDSGSSGSNGRFSSPKRNWVEYSHNLKSIPIKIKYVLQAILIQNSTPIRLDMVAW